MDVYCDRGPTWLQFPTELFQSWTHLPFKYIGNHLSPRGPSIGKCQFFQSCSFGGLLSIQSRQVWCGDYDQAVNWDFLDLCAKRVLIYREDSSCQVQCSMPTCVFLTILVLIVFEVMTKAFLLRNIRGL